MKVQLLTSIFVCIVIIYVGCIWLGVFDTTTYGWCLTKQSYLVPETAPNFRPGIDLDAVRNRGFCSELHRFSHRKVNLYRLGKKAIELPHHYDSRGLPYGLTATTRAILLKLFDIVDSKPFPKLPSNSTCLVVGSSGILKQQKLAEQINQYDYVFRFNNAPVQGYRKFVGSKINFYSTYYTAVREAMKSWRKDKAEHIFYFFTLNKELVLPFFYTDINQYKSLTAKYKVRPRPLELELAGNNVYKNIRSFYLTSNITIISPYLSKEVREHMLGNSSARPTTGLLGVTLALSMCPNRPDIAGFSLGANGSYPYHYYKAKTATGKDVKLANGIHNADYETNALRRMFECGVLGNDITKAVIH